MKVMTMSSDVTLFAEEDGRPSIRQTTIEIRQAIQKCRTVDQVEEFLLWLEAAVQWIRQQDYAAYSLDVPDINKYMAMLRHLQPDGRGSPMVGVKPAVERWLLAGDETSLFFIDGELVVYL